MNERGILFSAQMVRALFDGTKTQTRRVMKRQLVYGNVCGLFPSWYLPNNAGTGGTLYPNGKEAILATCPYGQIGDRLWVKEAFALSVIDPDGGTPEDDPENWDVIYRADPEQPGGGWTDGEGNAIEAPWKSDREMPRWASRILLEITGVRVERLQAIGERDARAEGVTIEERHTVGYCAGEFLPPSIRAYRDLWESINGAGSWDANPWVWVVEFRRAES